MSSSGGYEGVNTLSTSDRYLPDENAWRAGIALDEPSWGSCAVHIESSPGDWTSGARTILIGGIDERDRSTDRVRWWRKEWRTSSSSSMFRYEWETREWRTLAPLAEPRQLAACGLLRDGTRNWVVVAGEGIIGDACLCAHYAFQADIARARSPGAWRCST